MPPKAKVAKTTKVTKKDIPRSAIAVGTKGGDGIDEPEEKENVDLKDPHCQKSGSGKKKNADPVVVMESKASTKPMRYCFEEDTDNSPALGSDEMFDLIFKNAKTCGIGKESEQDRLQIKRDKKKFWGSSSRSKTHTGNSNNNFSMMANRGDKKVTAAKNALGDSDDEDEEVLAILADADALLNCNISDDLPLSQASTLTNSPSTSPTTTIYHSLSRTCPQNLQSKSCTVSDAVDISEDEDISQHQLSNNDSLGSLIFFQINLMGKQYPIRIHDLKKIQEVRNMLGKKAGVTPECLTIFFGDDVQLEDDQTVQECGLQNLCTLDSYYKEQTDQELYMADSDAILRFRLQTSDRRGRQTIYVFTKKSSPMRNVRDQYAKELGLDPSLIRLMFDGDCIDLNSLPEACDLEGEECIDVIIK